MAFLSIFREVNTHAQNNLMALASYAWGYNGSAFTETNPVIMLEQIE
jgi:hypothetical protein